MTDSEFIVANEVAEMIGMTDGHAFLRARTMLEEDHDFPAPMPMPLRPRKWRASAVRAWLECQGLPDRDRAMRNQSAFGPNIRLLDAARTA